MSSSSSSSSPSSPVVEAIFSGTTYYSEFRDVDSINNPILGNNVQMQYGGYWENNKDYLGYGIKRTLNSQGSIYCNDASKLFSMQSGYLGILLSLPFSITNGVYLPLKNDTSELNEYLLWGINVGRYETTQPSLYAALTPRGIEFTVWTSAGKHTIRDTSTSLYSNENVFIEFLWNNDEINDYLNRMEIKIDGSVVATGNPPMNNDDITNLNFYVLNTPFSYDNFECTIRKLLTYNDSQISIESQSSLSSSSSSSTEQRSSSSSSSSEVYWEFTARESSRNWIACASSTSGAVLAAVDNGGFIYISEDYGSTWTARMTDSNRGWSGIAFFSTSGSNIIATDLTGSKVYISTDYGHNWTPHNTVALSGIVANPAGGFFTAIGGSIVYYSNDGSTWLPVPSSPSSSYWSGLAYSPASGLGGEIVACYNAGFSGGALYTATNPPSPSWTSRVGAYPWQCVTVSSSGQYLAAGVGGGLDHIYTSTNYGSTWTAQPLLANWQAITSSSNGRKLAASGIVSGHEYIYTSTDYGSTWIPQTSANQPWVNIASSSNGSMLIAIAPSRQIYIGVEHN